MSFYPWGVEFWLWNTSRFGIGQNIDRRCVEILHKASMFSGASIYYHASLYIMRLGASLYYHASIYIIPFWCIPIHHASLYIIPFWCITIYHASLYIMHHYIWCVLVHHYISWITIYIYIYHASLYMICFGASLYISCITIYHMHFFCITTSSCIIIPCVLVHHYKSCITISYTFWYGLPKVKFCITTSRVSVCCRRWKIFRCISVHVYSNDLYMNLVRKPYS